ncbi:hypothetical protein RhiirA5_425108 [Rhizophagus irregularis]|uniref:Uncharacterized protein n=1 Tax=Rhizophagus irregularis TaxID=588596 RepID=A0A2I1F1B5_9GLOM|nr:hypothetical protein RhiirA5_425108 [Rhizophagus irregularis]PKC59432.1 hypothetical protein RhiirA1_469453 [Rhizophagus irregularis]PKY28158.1 hypothetical protein RhiirB3_444190 [Rhizophagus irregularis]
MSLMKEYDIRLDLKKVIECFINEKSFLETLYIVLQNMENTDPTNILKYVKRILPNDFQLIYLLYIFANFTDEYETSMKNYIKKIFQEQVAQLKLTEATNDTPVSTQAQPMETEIFENIE